jgi:hypothetical protein
MPTLLSDPPLALYLILVFAAIVGFVIWVNRRDRTSLVVFGSCAASLALVFLIDRLFESPREESVRGVQEMAKAIDDRKPEEFLSHIADTIQYQGEGGKTTTIKLEDLRKSQIWSMLNQYGVTHVAVWDFARDDVTQVDDNTVEIGFLGKAEAGSNQVPMYFRARFSRQTDGKMKLTTLASYDPMKRTNERKSIPNFP